MKKLILFLFILASCSSEPEQKQEVCLTLYMSGGHVRSECFKIPKNSKVYINSNQQLRYVESEYWNALQVVLKQNVIDFEIISKTDIK